MLNKRPTTLLFIALFCVPFCVIFNYTMPIMASPYIVGELGGSSSIATYCVSFFALGNALGIPLGKVLISKIGTVRLLLVTLLLFGIFSYSCPIAPNYPLFNVLRFLQGFVAGPFYALSSYLFFSLQPASKIKMFTAITLTLFTIGPVIGACFGGWVAYQWQWEWAFYLNIPIVLGLIVFLACRLRGFESKLIKKNCFDGIGYSSYFIGILCLGCAIILGQELDWFQSSLISYLSIVGILITIFFIFWTLHHPHPILNLRLLKKPVLSFALFTLAVLFSTYFGIVVLLALWLKLWANYTPDWIAALFGIMALSGLFPFFLITTGLSRLDNRIFLALSVIFLIISSIHTMTFSVDIDLQRIAYSRLSAGLGFAFFLAPLFKLAFHTLNSAEEVLDVLGLFQVTRALSSGLGASVYAVIWLRREVFFHERLGSKLTVNAPQTEAFFSKAKALGIEGEHATAKLDFFLQRQATALALDDCFYLMAWILIGLLGVFALTLFSKPGSFVTTEKASSNS